VLRWFVRYKAPSRAHSRVNVNVPRDFRYHKRQAILQWLLDCTPLTSEMGL